MSERARRLPPEECPDSVRIARRSDADELFKLIVPGVVSEIGFAPPNEDKIKNLIAEVTAPAVAINEPRPVVALIDGPDGKPVAAAPLIPKQFWYSDEFHYIQPWIYVKEQYRKSSYAKTLLGTMIWWANRAQLPMVLTCPYTKDNGPRREIYGRYAEPFGGSFIHAGGMGKPTPKPDGCRIADLRDYQQVRYLALLLNNENAAASLVEHKLDALLANVLQHQGGIIMVAEEGGKIVGCACLVLDQWDYSLSWHYSEMWVFVHPQYRSDGIADRLLKFCKWWAEQTGIPVTVGITSKLRTKAKMRLYSRYVKQLEAFFIHDPRAGRRESFSLASGGSAHGEEDPKGPTN